MSRTTNRGTAPAEAGSINDRLARLLDTSSLTRLVPHLAPETLHQLVRYRGLDACGDLLASATPAQLTALLDIDLWHHQRPAGDDELDASRFREWLDALMETGVDVAARTVASLDPHVVIAGLSRYLRVFDPGTFEPTESTDDEPMDRHEMMNSEGGTDLIECEVGGYLVRGRRTDAWDATVAILVGLDTDHHECFHAVMQGCRRLSHSMPEVDGLDALLMAPEQYVHDVAIEREDRRSRRGYATPADARAFLQMARKPGPGPGRSTPGTTNPIAVAYLRATEEEHADTAPHRASTGVPTPNDDVVVSVDEVSTLLAEAEVMPERPRALPGVVDGGEPCAARVPLLKRLMEGARQQNESVYLTRSHELGFLANTLLAGASVQSRSFTPLEASAAAASVCNLGLEHWTGTPSAFSSPQEAGTTPPHDGFLVDHDLVTIFEVGWSVLYQDVSLFVADRMLSALSDLRSIDADIDRGLRHLRRRLSTARGAGAPWLARDAVEVLAMLDPTAWVSLLGLLDECPIMPAALTAILERRTTPVDPTAFAFISTRHQIGDVRVFMRALPGVWSS